MRPEIFFFLPGNLPPWKSSSPDTFLPGKSPRTPGLFFNFLVPWAAFSNLEGEAVLPLSWNCPYPLSPVCPRTIPCPSPVCSFPCLFLRLSVLELSSVPCRLSRLSLPFCLLFPSLPFPLASFPSLPSRLLPFPLASCTLYLLFPLASRFPF